jgi:hypothetical protein
VASLPSQPQSSSPYPIRPDKYANLPYFNSWKRPSAEEDRQLAKDIFDDDAKPPAKSPVVSQSVLNNRAKMTQADIISETGNQVLQTRDFAQGKNHNSNPTTEPTIDLLEKLNQSIADKQAQLELLQSSILSLKGQGAHSDPQVTQDIEMQEVNYTSSTTPTPQMLGANRIDMKHAAQQEENPFILVQSKNAAQGKTKTTPVSASQMQSTSVLVPQPAQQPDPLTELAQRRPVYPVLPDPAPKRPYFYRTTWRIDIPKAADSPQKALLDAINETWVVLKEADEKLLVYPWRVKQHGQYKALSGPSKLPTTKEGITCYFTDAYFRPHPGSMYVRVYIGTSISYEELGTRTQYLFGATNNQTRVAFWKNHLQFEDTVEIGWLFRSMPGMSPDTIQKELFAHTGIHAAVCWKMISVVKFKGDIPKDYQVKALHILV